MDLRCPLCRAADRPSLAGEGKTPRRPYFLCGVCRLIFVPEPYFLEPEEERARYEQHDNRPEDPQYRNFLRPVFGAVAPQLRHGAAGLDYGCGPGPALVEMFREAGYAMEGYDPIFSPRAELLERKYDFVTCTETAEHFHDPYTEFARLHRLLKTGGLLAVLTQTWEDAASVPEWYYARDLTHVMFYHAETFVWLARHFGWKGQAFGKNVFLLTDAEGHGTAPMPASDPK